MFPHTFIGDRLHVYYVAMACRGWGEGVWGVQTPLPEIPKALQNRANLNPIVKTAKNC